MKQSHPQSQPDIDSTPGSPEFAVTIPYELIQDDAGTWFAIASDLIVSPDVYGVSDIKQCAIDAFHLRALTRHLDLCVRVETLTEREQREREYIAARCPALVRDEARR